MYARLRQKLVIAGAGTAVSSATSLGSLAASLLMKDLGRVITGLVTNVSGLNSEIWDTANSEIITTTPGGWSEYQSSYLTNSTNIPQDNTGNTNIIYLRSPSAMTTTGGATIYKYAGIGWGNNYTVNGDYLNMIIPWTQTTFTGNPTLTYRSNMYSGSFAANARNPFRVGILNEFIIYASARCLFFSNRYIGSSATAAQKIFAHFEYPATALSQTYNLCNQVIWELSNDPGSTTTGTGAAFNNTAYNIAGGYSPGAAGTDIYTTGPNSNINLGLVYTPYPSAPNGGWNSLWSTAAGTADMSTLKPATYGSMANTYDNSGNLITIPAMPLIHYPSWDSVYDMSSLTGVYATKPNLGSSGDTLTINGQDYAYVNATNMSYLVPRQ